MDKPATAPAKVPWIIQFQRKDLLTACWGGEKEANLLYHFLHKASWEVKNNHLESCKVIPFKEEHDEILEFVPMAEGTLIKYLKRFNLAGYVSSGRYGSTYTVNVEAIQAAFTNPPEKPLSAPRGRPKGFKVSRINKTKKSETLEENVETSRINQEKSEVSRIIEHEEVSRLNEKVLSLELEVLSLKEKVLNLELLVLNLKLSETRESAPEDGAGAKVSLQNDLEMIQKDSAIKGKYGEQHSEPEQPSANAPTHNLSQDGFADEPYHPNLGDTSQEQEMISPDVTVGSTIIHKDDPDERRQGKVQSIDETGKNGLVLWFGTRVPHWSSLNNMILFSEWLKTHGTFAPTHTGIPGRKPYPRLPIAESQPQATSSQEASVETEPVGSAGYKQDEKSIGKGKGSSKRKAAEPEEITLSPKARMVFDAWCSLFKVEVSLGPANAKAAEGLVQPLTVWGKELRMGLADLLKEIMNWLYTNDKRGFYKRGVKLFDISREFEGWQSAKEREINKNKPVQTSTLPSSISPATTTNYGLAALVADNPLMATGGIAL